MQSRGLFVQVRQASTFTESLGGHTGSEAGTAPGDVEDDYSVITPSEAGSAAAAAPGIEDICCGCYDCMGVAPLSMLGTGAQNSTIMFMPVW